MRLSQRLAAVFAAFGLAIAGGFQLYHLRLIRSQSYQRAQTMAEVTAAAVRAMAENQAQLPSFGRLGERFEEMVRQRGVAYMVVIDSRGRRLVGRSDGYVSRAHSPHPGVPIEEVKDGFYDLELPVDLASRGEGILQIGFHTRALEEELRKIGSRAAGLGVMAFLGITLFAWLIGYSFGRRIERLVPRIEALPRDPEGFRPLKPAPGRDEVSRLVEAFNRLGASLKEATRRRRELEEEKRDLSAMLVHDLKTPLTVIRSGIALLQEQVGSPRPYRRTFELLELSAQRLQRMIEDVLQLARLEEVAGLKERSSVDLGSLARACAKDFELVAAERGLKLSLKLPKGRLPPVMGDAVLLRRVIDNLVHNAVEHTPAQGTVTLCVAAEGSHLRLSVSDGGPGVPPEARADLFRKFFRRDLKRHVGNVGLGLALCEKVVRRHDGEIGVEDAEPQGARFYFRLPSAEPALPLEAAVL